MYGMVPYKLCTHNIRSGGCMYVEVGMYSFGMYHVPTLYTIHKTLGDMYAQKIPVGGYLHIDREQKKASSVTNYQ